jgi:ankyrin repeat protein
MRKLLYIGLLCMSFTVVAQDKPGTKLSVDYEVARAHEQKPHRRSIPVQGAQGGFSQLHLALTVSRVGDVTGADAEGDKATMKLWPSVQGEVWQWKFKPFEQNGKPTDAQVEEYVDLVPPERLPTQHVLSPIVKPNSKVAITLQRSGCFGSCPSYSVTVSTDGVVFDGGGYVVARGKHTDSIDAEAVRALAKKFVAADFYSMDEKYVAGVTDNPTYVLEASIDGNSKKVVDYVGSWMGMPEVITELEEEVDSLAKTSIWIEGSDGLVAALQAEKYDFKTFDAQVILKEASQRGQAQTMRDLLAAGVGLMPLPAPKPQEPYEVAPFDKVGWLQAASGHLESLLVLIGAGASTEDQADKDLALYGAAETGDVQGVRALLGYGANPNVDLRKLTVTQEGAGMTMQGPGSGSILIAAASSGNPEMVKEILKFHPNLEARDREGKTAMFAATDYRSSDKDGDRVECVRLLAKAGANVNARDEDGNTPLHETFLTDVEEELLKQGADVNARNKDGETPIFTTVDDDAMAVFIKHGADLNIHNNKGETVIEAASSHGPLRAEALRKAIAEREK